MSCGHSAIALDHCYSPTMGTANADHDKVCGIVRQIGDKIVHLMIKA